MKTQESLTVNFDDAQAAIAVVEAHVHGVWQDILSFAGVRRDDVIRNSQRKALNHVAAFVIQGTDEHDETVLSEL